MGFEKALNNFAVQMCNCFICFNLKIQQYSALLCFNGNKCLLHINMSNIKKYHYKYMAVLILCIVFLVSCSSRDSSGGTSNIISSKSDDLSMATALETDQLWEIYNKAKEKTEGLLEYNSIYTENYICTAAGLDETTIVNIQKCEDGTFNYEYDHTIYAGRNHIRAYSGNGQSLFIDNNGTLEMASINAFTIEEPEIPEFAKGDIVSSRKSVHNNYTAIIFEIQNDEKFKELVNNSKNYLQIGLENADIFVYKYQLCITVNEGGYLVNCRRIYSIYAIGDKEGVDHNTFTAIEYLKYNNPGRKVIVQKPDFVMDIIKNNQNF